jgi:ABC-type branched-subunit amino acid transport system ATPase component
MSAIVVEALAKRIGEVTAVVDVSFEVREGALADSYLTLVVATNEGGR